MGNKQPDQACYQQKRVALHMCRTHPTRRLLPANVPAWCYRRPMAYPLLADLQDRAALAAHLADKAAGRGGVSLDELDAALDRIDADSLS